MRSQSMRSLALLTAFVGPFLSSACSDDGGATQGRTYQDGGTDASETDGSTLPDGATSDGGGGADAGDATTGDGETDAGPDAIPDAAPQDATPDTTPDAGIDYLLAPTVHCAPTGDACSLPTPVPGIFASYRKDAFYPKSLYDENNDDPVDGGRFQIAAVAQAAGAVTSVRVNGVDLDQALNDASIQFEDNPAEWFHVWPDELTVGEPVWVSFHSRDPAWDAAATGQIDVQTVSGQAVGGAFPVQTTPVPLTYVTTTTDRSSYLLHVRNGDSKAHSVSRILVNGRDVTGPDVACVPKDTIEPGETVMWTVPWCATIEPGSAWTVVVEYDDAPAAVGAGRVVKPHFVVESWNNSSECPFPGAKQDNFLAYQAAGFDTAYHHGGQPSGCDTFDNYEMLNVTAPQTDNFYFLGTDGFVMGLPQLTDTSGLAGIATGDESDGSIYQNDDEEADYGKPKAWGKAKKSTAAWAKYPEVPTFNGAMTNRNVGTFAGMADIQGIDLYAAACAPHITSVFNHPPLRGPYDYLRNARNNHMPLPTWLYAQGLSPAWNTTQPITNAKIHVQPDPQEILVQALSVVAAGGKGLMWFQANQDEAEHAPHRWQAIARANWMIRGVRDILREGDVTGMASGPDDVIVELVRGVDAMVLVVINLNHSAAPDDVSCNTNKYISEQAVPHWILNDYTPAVELAVPDDFGVHEIFEVRDGSTHDLATAPVIDGRTIRFDAVPLSNDQPVRLYVMASDPAVRGRVETAVHP